ncbi:hypothetical protein [Flavobacterium sp.]|uniref:hypothetical protein n=1 Tax=Flavobacterium sp. TaxID=239 RepID=UPI0039E471FC
MRLWIVVLLCTLSMTAQKRYALEGKLGKQDIFMFFSDYTGTEYASDDKRILDVRYFYKNSLKDIVLEGRREKNGFTFFFEDHDTIFEQFTLTEKADLSLVGTWKGKNGKSLAVSLHPTSYSYLSEKYNWLDYDKDDQPFDLAKAELLSFRKDSTSTFKGQKIDWYTETHCAAPMFRLVDGFPKKERDIVNQKLQRIHYQLAINQLGCASRYDYSDGKGMEISIEMGYLDQNLLGFEINCFYYCGGAHPDVWHAGNLIDMHNGYEYGLDEILEFDPSAQQIAGNDERRWEYRENYFAPKLYALLNQEYHFKKPAISPEGQEQDPCDYTELEYWESVSWAFTTKGINFTPYFYRLARNCEEPFLVPFELLRAYRNPSFPYRF